MCLQTPYFQVGGWRRKETIVEDKSLGTKLRRLGRSNKAELVTDCSCKGDQRS